MAELPKPSQSVKDQTRSPLVGGAKNGLKAQLDAAAKRRLS